MLADETDAYFGLFPSFCFSIKAKRFGSQAMLPSSSRREKLSLLSPLVAVNLYSRSRCPKNACIFSLLVLAASLVNDD
jgi:hypothetical protein